MKDATIVIPEDLGAELEAVAQEQGLAAAEVIAAALLVYRAEIHRHHPPPDRGDFRPFWVPVLPENLEAEVEHFRKQQDEPIALKTVVEEALREYLTRRQRLGGREYRPASRPFKLMPGEEKDDLDESDVSINHDKYFAESTLAQKLPKKR